MSKRPSNSDRIAKIESDHKRLLTMVKDSIVENKDNLLGEIDTIMLALSTDEAQVKQYKAVVKAKGLIEQLVEQILNANTVEDVLKIRNRINYYINKIKKEMISRNLSQEEIDRYQEKSSYLRKDIAKVIRVLKREEKISHINSCISGGDVQDKASINKMLKNEQRFNNYYFNPSKKRTSRKKVVEHKPVVDTINLTDTAVIPENTDVFQEGHDDRLILPEGFSLAPRGTEPNAENHDSLEAYFSSLPSNTEKEEPDDKVLTIFDFLDNQNDTTRTPNNLNATGIYESDEEYLNEMAHRFSDQYGVLPLEEYDSSRIKNAGRFLSNIPAHVHNKRLLSKMIFDSETFYCGSDLRSFISYTRRRNSIAHALKCVFSKSYLSQEEIQCLNNHARCAEWLDNYCSRRHLDHYYVRKA